jgi:glycosyltransferase involved in cell wall biosynthesis
MTQDHLSTPGWTASQVARISIVVPMFNEASNVRELLESCENVTSALTGVDWEYVFVNDGSRDESLSVLHKIARVKKYVKVVDLSRNFGKDAALTAGLAYATGDAIICMDADLQHPPELIPEMVEAWRKGAEVVVAIRRTDEKKGIVRSLGSYGYHFIMNRISDHESVSRSTDFRLVDRKVCDAVLMIRERQRLFRGLVDWLGYERVNIEFDSPARRSGKPAYTLRNLWNLAIYSFVSHSHFPLRFVLYLGCFISGTSALGLLWMLTASKLAGITRRSRKPWCSTPSSSGSSWSLWESSGCTCRRSTLKSAVDRSTQCGSP